MRQQYGTAKQSIQVSWDAKWYHDAMPCHVNKILELRKGVLASNLLALASVMGARACHAWDVEIAIFADDGISKGGLGKEGTRNQVAKQRAAISSRKSSLLFSTIIIHIEAMTVPQHPRVLICPGAQACLGVTAHSQTCCCACAS